MTALQERERQAEAENIERVRRGHEPEYVRLIPLQVSGETHWFSLQARPFPLANSETGVVLYKQPVDLAMDGYLGTREVLESMTDAFILIDGDLNFRYLNGAAEKLIQLNRTEVIGKNVWEVFPEAKDSVFHTNYRKLKMGQVDVQFDFYAQAFAKWFDVRAYRVANKGLAIYFRDASERKATEQLLEEKAYYDYLTGLPNRWKIEQTIQQLLQNGSRFSLFYINLNKLKFINDLHSHRTGDEVLKKVAERLKGIARSDNAISRFEGDEFLLVHEHGTGQGYRTFEAEVLQAFAEPFVLENAQCIQMGASIGIASYPDHARDVEELITCAGTAMAEAKKETTTSCSVFSPDMRFKLARRVKIEQDLAGDLGEAGIYHVLQPQIHGVTGELRGVEVLARWQHPEFGAISPTEFIQIAEETGTIARLTYYLIEDVFDSMKKRETAYKGRLRTAINITPTLLSSKPFFDEFFRLIEEYGILPELLEIEVTESMDFTYSSLAFGHLMECQAKGISIAIDDFGTGFSRLTTLIDFPVDKIKLDRFFVQKIGMDRKAEVVLESLIRFVKTLDCEILAEGVEHERERAFLNRMGCTIHQGYYYAKPMGICDFEKMYLGEKPTGSFG
ncbi:hypothetical protein B0X71_19045 (plasmid) [Planococcus lenghuensis]|uniref:GGDEF domain-containing protein n=1 Tax=Planococcus lenghuensis TaxID=2213202 RepID=A0A1Q2L521_9BACL|nr:hypothetical protein B0X71_18730 [Planococcus lenghuensis]AQQ55501.1 hypothetical protein B0X71_19045 [Planococcus lenghuensis]